MKFRFEDCVDKRDIFAQRYYAIAESMGIDASSTLRLDSAEHEYSKASNPSHLININSSASCTLIVPGLLGNSMRALVAPLLCARNSLTVKGYDINVAWVSGRSGCRHNAGQLRKYVLDAADRCGAPINLISYSKGCADSMFMLSAYAETQGAVRALVSYAGIVRGSPLAENVPTWLNKFLQYVPLPGEAFGDGRAIADLSPQRRRRWLEDHPLPEHIKLASVVAVPSPEMVSRLLKASYRKLAKIDSDNDSQVLARDAILPASELLALVNADHWAIALPIAERHKLLARLLVDKNEFPRDIMLQAIIDHLDNQPE